MELLLEELCIEDRQGLLAEVMRTFRENGLNVTRAEISIIGNMASNAPLTWASLQRLSKASTVFDPPGNRLLFLFNFYRNYGLPNFKVHFKYIVHNKRILGNIYWHYKKNDLYLRTKTVTINKKSVGKCMIDFVLRSFFCQLWGSV